jgi:hypothetical protein
VLGICLLVFWLTVAALILTDVLKPTWLRSVCGAEPPAAPRRAWAKQVHVRRARRS